ncbi:BgTH12-04500 [Blumeria graminis f. sp. triticale]|uniref:BgTH12-04500 n=1 Tax=Blumeria graminis f. sp. triticale TaxID=1689686 RepID=A0A9W4CYV7_BLUGR|nr:BgTH12-04500 [Blumeria graminis f. sp. triticale]
MDCTLRNAGLFHQTEEQFNNEEVDNGQYFVDRRYGEKLGYVRGGLHARGGRSSFKGGLQGGSGSNNDRRKICFVCKKVGCWTTRHKPSDRQGRINSWRTYMAENDLPADNDTLGMFIIDYEDYEVNQNDDKTDLIGMFNMWSEDKTEQFLTSYGTIDGRSTAVLLNNKAAKHTLTANDPFESAQSEPSSIFQFHSRYDSEIFQGILPDTRAAGLSTAGENQVKALQVIISELEIDTRTAGNHRITFGDSPHVATLGTVDVKIPFGTIIFTVVQANTTFLLCLTDMEKHCVFLDNTHDLLVHTNKQGKQEIYPVVRKWGHPFFLDLEATAVACRLTEIELRQLYRRFGHPAADRLSKLLSRAGYDDFNEDTLRQINMFYHQCQIHSKAPGRFRFTLREDMNFNFRLIVDFMYIQGKPVLHAVDEATAFQAARFLPNMTVKATWETLRAMWIDT